MTKKHVAQKVMTRDGLVHIAPTKGEFDPCSTYCCEVDDSEEVYTDTDNDVTCGTCKHTFDILRYGIKLRGC